jgi:hypothetical protein
LSSGLGSLLSDLFALYFCLFLYLGYDIIGGVWDLSFWGSYGMEIEMGIGMRIWI